MLRWVFIVGLAVISGVIGYLITYQGLKDTWKTGAKSPLQIIEVKGLKIIGPYTHKNLTIYLIHGKETDKEDYLTLEEAMAQKQVVVYEIEKVNELEIENLSNKPVFVQAGDIVKGGKQDRTLAKDFVVPPRSGKMPIASFCVERGRWSRRGDESAKIFNSPGQDLSLQRGKPFSSSQEKVWEDVEKTQGELARGLAEREKIRDFHNSRACQLPPGWQTPAEAGIRDPSSPSSLLLTLENKELQKAIEDYTKALSKIVEGQSDVVGFAFAINGKLNSADVYGSNKLFKKLWLKLLKASAVEAIAQYKKDQTIELYDITDKIIKVDIPEGFFRDAENGKATEKETNDKMKEIMRETDKNLLFETQNQGQTIHKNYFKK